MEPNAMKLFQKNSGRKKYSSVLMHSGVMLGDPEVGFGAIFSPQELGSGTVLQCKGRNPIFICCLGI